MRLLSMILRLLGRLLRSFIILLSIIFIGIPLGILMLIFPPLRRKIESLNSSSRSRSSDKSTHQTIQDITTVDQLSQEITPDTKVPNSVYVLLYNVGTDNEGIHTISVDDNHKILLFESQEDAATFARRLGEQNFPVPSVEAIEAEEILLFCKNSGDDWEFVAQGTNRIPPSENQKINQQNTFVDQSSQELTLNTEIPNQQDYLNFLMDSLQRISENPNPQVIYPFWAQNLDKLDDNLARILDSWARETLTQATPEQAYSIAAVIFYFSDLIQQFPLGDITTHKEIAITGYEIVLTIFTFDAFPQEWALTQNNLAIAYLNRIRGEKAKNLERAITACQEALKVLTFDGFPQNWALNPQNWALTQYNLAVAYIDRIRGEKAENLERAIAACQEALKVRTFDAFPQEWAATQNNLAVAYINRIRGEKAENLERAITTCNEALKVYTFDAFPQDWATTQHNLANAYHDRIRGEQAGNLEKAIAAYQEALKVYTFDAFPQKWARTQNNLAGAYSDRIRGDKAENLEKAIATYQEALKVYTFDAFPQDWARTQNNLAGAYSDRIRGDEAENLERAISAYQDALKVFTFDAFPQDWATTQNNLAIAYSNRIRGDKADNLEKAITSYQNALTIRTKEADPLKCLQTARNLAILHYSEEQWQPATEAYNTAIEAVENARLEALNPQSRQEVLSNAIGVFHRIVQAHLNLNQPEKALEYIERSKGRNLVELITQKNLHPQGVSQEIIAQLNELKQRVVNEQIRLQHQSINQNLMRSDNLTPYVQDHSYLKEYQQDLDNFIAREIKDPLFSLTQKVEPIPFTEIQALTDAETCLLQWYITGEKILAFVVSAEGEVKVWQSSENDKNQFLDTFDNYRELYYSKNGKQEWRNQLSNLLQTFADILHINDILALIPDTCQRLIIIPHWFLHILPIHALPVDPPQLSLKSGESATGGSELQDLFPKGVQYAPSCQILQKITQTFHHSEFNKLFAIQNPTKDLFYTDLEVNILSTFFTEPQVIAQDNATKNAVLPHLKSSDNHCYHF
ncbi:DUF3110 domain-containing protein, partial [Microcystis aeruginosa]|uniref:DUF3110 domain-containing protein n=1 Tax=Microcystis aeruginosa TaxID=1126 RepID=UPI00232C1E9D